MNIEELSEYLLKRNMEQPAEEDMWWLHEHQTPEQAHLLGLLLIGTQIKTWERLRLRFWRSKFVNVVMLPLTGYRAPSADPLIDDSPGFMIYETMGTMIFNPAALLAPDEFVKVLEDKLEELKAEPSEHQLPELPRFYLGPD